MRPLGKLVLLALLAAGGGLVWQNREARAQIFHGLEVARDGLNRLGAGYEPWQVYTIGIITTDSS